MTTSERDRAGAPGQLSGIPIEVGAGGPKACCAPGRGGDVPVLGATPGGVGPRRPADVDGLVALGSGTFLMGTDDPDGFTDDREGPVRTAAVTAFSIGATTVTNAEFAEFVEATGHVTDAERYGWSFVFHLFVPPTTVGHVRGRSGVAPWWLAVDGATWDRPFGPGAGVGGLGEMGDHPVVHVSHHDALAYCAWAGGRLPSETEWEFAARGGLEQARYPWGDELEPGGEHRCNVWQGDFPLANTSADGWVGTAPVRSYEPNGYGLYEVAGNVWEHCADAWLDDRGAAVGDESVIRGGSYLCHASYCNRYRVAARSHTSRESSTGNTGFRLAR